MASAAGARLVVSRTDSRDMRIRNVEIFLDGERIADLAFGATVEREIEPGPHELRVSNTVYGRRARFTAEPGDVIRFQAGNVMRGILSVMIGSLGFPHYRVFLEPDQSSSDENENPGPSHPNHG